MDNLAARRNSRDAVQRRPWLLGGLAGAAASLVAGSICCPSPAQGGLCKVPPGVLSSFVPGPPAEWGGTNCGAGCSPVESCGATAVERALSFVP